MIITNKHNLPEFIFDFLSHSFYSGKKSDLKTLSVTTLLRPTQAIVLEKMYGDKIETDITDKIYAWMGSALHSVLQNIGGEGIMKPERIEMPVMTYNGETYYLSGEFDIGQGDMVWDFKFTSVGVMANAYLTQDRFHEWTLQLSMYRWLIFKQSGKKLSDTGKILAFFRDHKEKERKTSPTYPKVPFLEISLDLLTLDETEAFITKRFSEIVPLLGKSENLPECTEKERWEFKGYPIRCNKYCDAKAFCEQFKKGGKNA